MADQLEGGRSLPVKFKDQGDGSVAEAIAIAGTVLVGTSTLAAASNPGSVVATGTASAALVASNAARRYLVLFNTGSSDVWVSLGGTAVVGQGIRLPAGGGWEMPANALYTGALNAIGAAASTVAVTEY